VRRLPGVGERDREPVGASAIWVRGVGGGVVGVHGVAFGAQLARALVAERGGGPTHSFEGSRFPRSRAFFPN
jgi:hypothetical protein